MKYLEFFRTIERNWLSTVSHKQFRKALHLGNLKFCKEKCYD